MKCSLGISIIARREKKPFLIDQCNEIDENNRMGKTTDLFKKIKATKDISCKDGLDKGEKWYGPNRSKILRRGHKNTQKKYTKKIFITQITTIVRSLT